MALPEKRTSNGWLSQAERLVVMHRTAGTTAVHATELARQRPLLKLAKSTQEFLDSEELSDTATRETQIAEELELALAKINGLARRVTHEKCTSESLKQELEQVSRQLGAAEARIGDLETELAAAQATAALRDNETLSLQTSLDLVSAENSRLQAQLRLSESMLEDANAQSKSLWNEAAASETKRVTCMREAERYRAEAEAKQALLEAAKSRAELAEQTHAGLRERLSRCVEESSLNMRRIAELTDICIEKNRKLDELQDILRAKHLQIDELEKSRRDLAAATNALLMSYQSHQSGLRQGESCAAARAPNVVQTVAEPPVASTHDAHDMRRGKLIQLARELAKLNCKRQHAASAQTISASATS
jgi:chromosome segregation ATPase